MKKICACFTIVLFFSFLTVFCVWSICEPDRAVSTAENRTLTQRPVNDLHDLPALTAKISDYVVDQFPLREQLMKCYSALELAQGKRYVRNTYVTPDGWLFQRVYSANDEARKRFANAIAGAAQQVPVTFAVLPQKTEALTPLLAPYADNTIGAENKEKLFAALSEVPNLTVIDVGDYFQQSFSLAQREQMYFKTDFHWNENGAFAAAQYIAQNLPDIEADLPTRDDFIWEDLGINHGWQGDLNLRFSNLLSTKDTIPYYHPADTSALQYELSADGSKPAKREEIVATGLEEDLISYNGLSTYNLGCYRVVNPEARCDKHVLILGASFRNATTDYFSQLFSDITMIDPRSYAEPYTFSELLELRQIDFVLLIYHQDNFSEELISFLQP